MPPLTAKKLLKILKENNFILSRKRGSHVIYKHIDFKIIVSVPMHGRNKTIPIGTFLAIVKQSRISKSKFK